MKDNTLAKLTPAESKRFLTELANLRDDALARFQRNFGRMMPDNLAAIFVFDTQAKSYKVGPEELKMRARERRVIELRDLVRKVWTEPDLRTKRYGVFLLWKYSMFSQNFAEEGIPSGLPAPSLFEQAIQILIQAPEQARYCGNPECLTPYFFVSRRNQKYCSDVCSASAQKEFKRQWWAEHGEEWRAARHPKQPTSRKNPGKRSKKPRR